MEKNNVVFKFMRRRAILRLIRDKKIALPESEDSVSIPKDMRWNEQQMTARVLRGLEMGWSIPKIANALMEVIGKNKKSAVRHARTRVTSAENHGRLDSYRNLSDQGTVMVKIWIATPDSRTRQWHLDIDGEEQDVDSPFSNGLMFPGDGTGPPREVWNCRCSMGTRIIGFRRKDGSISYVNSGMDDTIHEGQMAAEKERRGRR